jgi:hypothetical protein
MDEYAKYRLTTMHMNTPETHQATNMNIVAFQCTCPSPVTIYASFIGSGEDSGVNLCGLPGFATGFVGGFGFCTAEVGRVVGARGRKWNGGRSSLFVRQGQFMSQGSAKQR